MQPVRKIFFAVALIFIFAGIASANYVSSGKHDFATAASTACVPNSGGVTSGDWEVMWVQANSATSVTISSTRVSSWTRDAAWAANSANLYFYHGQASSSGSETITVSFSTGSALIGSACGEYSAPTFGSSVFTTSSSESITVSGGADIVVGSSSAGGGITLSSPWNQRQQVLAGGTAYMVFGDQTVSSSGTYSVTPSGGTNGVAMSSFLSGSGGGGRHRLIQN